MTCQPQGPALWGSYLPSAPISRLEGGHGDGPWTRSCGAMPQKEARPGVPGQPGDQACWPAHPSSRSGQLRWEMREHEPSVLFSPLLKHLTPCESVSDLLFITHPQWRLENMNVNSNFPFLVEVSAHIAWLLVLTSTVCHFRFLTPGGWPRCL